ncbi:TPA: hypothetical protein KLD61_000679 [Legionella pneumophila]|nr:hypothetical protein [Legionella pneumophila]HAT7924228.1 hypothetical protein [Legionella pneumophila]HAU2304506.1 hypothetical protein [Legionella pneumophila]HBD7220240.1 hypothetical protein [Legionella pneumophila]HBD7288588.1 hypothetical protein [Legionella pneumophila]
MYNYKGHLIFNKGLTPDRKTKFEKEVDYTHQLVSQDYDSYWENHEINRPKHIETIAQIILMRIMPDHKIIMMDNGAQNNQYDFLVLGTDHRISIEVTQAINEDDLKLHKFLQENGHKIQIKELTFNWILNLNTNAKKIVPKILMMNLKQIEYFCFQNGLTEFRSKNIYARCPELSQPLEKLSGVGVTNLIGKYNKLKGMIEIYGPFESSSYSLNHFFDIIGDVCNKPDNKKKLLASKTVSRHIFIPVSFNTAAAYTIHTFPPNRQELSFESVTNHIPDFIDCVWLSTFFNFTKDGVMGFKLIKITRDNQNYILENISAGIAPYRKTQNHSE